MYSAQNGHDQVRSSQLDYVDNCITVLCAQFHTFSSHRLEQVARALLEAGARKDVESNAGSTALSLARMNGHSEICELLEA